VSSEGQSALFGLLMTAALVVALDQWSKAYVLSRAGSRARAARWDERMRPLAATLLGLRLRIPLSTLLALWLALTALLLFAAAFEPSLGVAPARFAFGIALGGATSNLIDIQRRGAVVDFIDLRVWPVFNLADAAIVLGVTVALLRAAAW
jgi:signal peptidase II